ncbi:MAG: biotin/lipoyl-binding protein [Prevotella sp.]|nr:biotin/lipoyl-binding protein [Prevotella sp.]MCI7088298.1 biotin/lipoyl-binding protein [Prevotella sp.]MCI7256056.1 biotin/lipoyl-binding protein [Prevotella sp.]MDD6864085.1 biotin/lipoyl-binding protein [Prevotella sp.]MDD7225939.1 biotin/lipoyl-binding protein [Prevotella sp.]
MNKFEYKVQGVDYEVEIEEMEGNIAKVSVNGIPFEVELKQPINPAKAITRPKVVAPAPAAAAPAAPVSRPAAPAAPAGAGSPVKAPLPGTISSVNVKVGDKVNVGDTVVVLEAMKMQNNIEAENSGTVTSILVNQGDSVMEGATLITIG